MNDTHVFVHERSTTSLEVERVNDGRVKCLDCKHFRPWMCFNHRAALLSTPEVGPDLASLRQRCPGWQRAKEVTR